MPEDVQVADPSSAETPVEPSTEQQQPTEARRDPQEYASPAETLNAMTPAQREKWLSTGELPNDAAPAPAQEESSASGEKPEEKAAPAPEAGKKPQEPPQPKQRQRKPDAEHRITELSRENAELRRQLAESKQAPKPDAKPPESSAGKPAVHTQPQGPQPPAEPDPNKFATWPEYQAAHKKYIADLATFTATQAVEAREKQAEIARQNKALEERWLNRISKAAEKRGISVAEFNALAFGNMPPINMPTNVYCLRSEIGPEIVAYLTENPAEAKRIHGLDPVDTVRELALIEHSLKDPKPAPEPKLTRTPPPPAKIGARNSAPADEKESAVAEHDFARYKRLADREDLAARK